MTDELVTRKYQFVGGLAGGLVAAPAAGLTRGAAEEIVGALRSEATAANAAQAAAGEIRAATAATKGATPTAGSRVKVTALETAEGCLGGGMKIRTLTWKEMLFDESGSIFPKRTKPRNAHLAGSEHPKTQVPFDSKGYPIFDSVHDVELPSELIGPNVSNNAQFSYATTKLRAELEINPTLRNSFTEEQLAAIEAGEPKIPGYTWHHHQDGVTLELTPSGPHGQTGHSGGRQATGGRP